MANVLDGNIVVSEFELQSRYLTNSLGYGSEPDILPAKR